ncbi:MAG: DUF444 family protein [Bacteroidales bacterium]|nr:DUF444 family protein [Bacteroidales bacterium]
MSENLSNREFDKLKNRDFPKENAEQKAIVQSFVFELYNKNDFQFIQQFSSPIQSATLNLKTLDELLEHDKQREKDGFPKRIRLGKLVKPLPGNKTKVIVVPTTTEPKFYHDNSVTEEEQATGGSGEGEEGEVIGRQKIDPQQGEGDGSGPGQGKSSEHEIGTNAFDLGKLLTEKFQLPNLKNKGHKKSLTKYTYDLTDINRGFGQLLDKKASLKNIIKTNILLGNINYDKDFDPEKLIIDPKNKIYRILSKEKDFEAQAAVFFIRDYSGSMTGKPTEAVTTLHLLIYSWLMYQYQNNVLTKFIVHDTEAKEVPDFYTYYKYQVAGGTNVYPAFEMANKIVELEQLNKDYNIYVFYGTDGDDWETTGEKMQKALQIMIKYANRTGICVARNGWTSGKTTIEKYLDNSGILKKEPELIRLDHFMAENYTQDKLIESIKKLIS